ncbi:MAG: methyltransferase domain-containing protein [Candidatus Omnitrophota bacterium]
MIDSKQKLKKLNIGSGPHGKPDWINLDWGILPFLSKMPWIGNLILKLGLLPRDYPTVWQSRPKLRDCRKKLPFLTSSVDYIYTSHFLEHLYRYQAIKLLAECKRVLHPGGILRISVPDLKILIEKHLKNDLEFFKDQCGSKSDVFLEDISDLFNQYFYGYDCWREPNLLHKLHRKFIRGHCWMWTYESLSNILREAGFTDIRNCQPGSGRVPDIDFLDIHRDSSLFVEASF